MNRPKYFFYTECLINVIKVPSSLQVLNQKGTKNVNTEKLEWDP